MLTNEDLGYEKLDANSIETNAESNTSATSSLFKNNNFIIKVNHSDNGFDSSNKSYVFFKNCVDVGGVAASQLNSALFQVRNTGIDYYNIVSTTRASSNSFGGGTSILASYNRKFEKLHATVPYLSFGGTEVNSFVQTTNVAPVDDDLNTFTSYSQTQYEKTFLNEDVFFINQKVIASRVNQIINNLDRSLTYRMDLSSSQDHLSPLIDLSRSTVKTITNKVESAKGKEDRFGRRNQILEFYPVYSFIVSGVDTSTEIIQSGQTVAGSTTNASGEIVKVSGTTVFVKLKTTNSFTPGEELSFSNQTFASTTSVELSGASKVVFQIPNITVPPTYVTARNPSVLADTYDNKITGKIVLWNQKSGKLTLVNDKQPLSDDYTGKIVDSATFTRNASVDDQNEDIFRVGDIISYQDQPGDEQNFIEISKITYSDGVDYISDTQSKNSSSIAKYVTKEVSIENPGTSIDVRTTVNVSDIENIKILYRIKKSSSQENFEDIEWVYFNEDGSPDIDVIATAENSISGISEKQSSYQELSYSVEDLPEFSSFAIKIVMKSTNPAFVPKVQDLRVVASY